MYVYIIYFILHLYICIKNIFMVFLVKFTGVKTLKTKNKEKERERKKMGQYNKNLGSTCFSVLNLWLSESNFTDI